MSLNILPTFRGAINLDHAFYLKEQSNTGVWEMIQGGSLPHARNNERLSGAEFDKWLSQLPAGWIELFDLDLAHVLVNLSACSSIYGGGPDPRKGFRHTFVPAHSVSGAYQFDHDLCVRVKEESLSECLASADQPVSKRVKIGMKEMERERS